MSTTISVGMGEIAVTGEPNTELVCLGLGSCIAICAYDPRRRVGAMVHVVLPTANGKIEDPPAKYASSAIPLLTAELQSRGVRKSDVRVVLCGGAAIFAPLSGVMDIGQRNLTAVRAGLQEVKLAVVREDVGGRESRTVMLNVGTGIIRLRTVRSGEVVFADLKAI